MLNLSSFPRRGQGGSCTFPLIVAVLAAFAPEALASQNEAPELSSLRAPPSPAFILLDVAPTEVQRPTNPADLAFSLVNSTSTFSELPENFAVEAAPYWFTTRRTLTWDKDNKRSVMQSFLRTFTLSSASAEIGTEAAPVTGLSLGGRGMLLSGRYSKATQDSLRAMQNALAEEGRLNQDAADDLIDVLDAWFLAEMAKPGADTAAIRAEYTRRRTAIDDAVLSNPEYQRQVKTLRAQFNDYAVRREGHMLEIAGGAAWGFPGAVWDAGTLHRWAAWATYGCEGCTALPGGVPITPVVMVRYQGGEDDVDGDVLDVGGRLIVSDPRWGLSVEGVWRQFTGGSDADALYRIAGHVEYQVRKDTWLLATFGRDQDASSEGSLLAQLGFKFNFTEQRYQP